MTDIGINFTDAKAESDFRITHLALWISKRRDKALEDWLKANRAMTDAIHDSTIDEFRELGRIADKKSAYYQAHADLLTDLYEEII